MQTAANTLRLMTAKETIDPSLRDNLQWVGQFLQQVDLSTFGQTGISADFAIQATEARPFFYEALASIDSLMHVSGTQTEVSAFLNDTSAFLRSRGDISIARDRLSLAATILEKFANAILTQLKRIPPSPVLGLTVEMAI